MSTEATNLETMLDAESPAPESQPASVVATPTGDNSSAAPPADAGNEQQPSPGSDGPMVPRAALEDERKKRQEFERRLAEFERRLQPQPQQQQPQQPAFPQTPPDMFQDPEGYTQWVMTVAVHNAQHTAERQMLNRDLNRSEQRARKAHGDEIVNAAFEAAGQAGLARRFIDADDAYGEMVDWYKSYQIASDPAKYREQIEAEILAKHGIVPNGQPAAPKPSSAPVPRSLASTPNAQPRNTLGQFAGPKSLDELLG